MKAISILWTFKQFIISRVVICLIVIGFYSFLNIEKSDKSSSILSQYEEDTSIYLSDKVSYFEKSLLSFLSYFYSYDSSHYIHIAIKLHTHLKNLAFFPLFPYIIRSIAYIIQTYLFTFQLKITSYLLGGFLISNTLSLINVLLMNVFFSKILNTSSTYGIKILKLSLILFLYNPGTIFHISIYTESLYTTLHLFILFYLINNPPDKLLTFNNIITISAPLVMANGLKSNSVILGLYFFVPLFVFILKGFDNGKLKNENRKENLLCILRGLNKNKLLSLKSIFLFILSILCFFFFSKIMTKNSICSNLTNKLRIFRSNELLLDQNSNFTWVNNTVYYNNSTMHSYDISQDEFFDFCAKNELNTNIYSEIQYKYWNTGFLHQFKLLPNNLDRLILSIPMNLLTLLYFICILKKYFNFSSLLNLDMISFFKVNIFSFPICSSHQSKDPQSTLGKYKDYTYQYKAILLMSMLYHVALTLVIFFFGHWQINNRLLSCSPMFYLFVAEMLIDGDVDKTPGKDKENKEDEKEKANVVDLSLFSLSQQLRLTNISSTILNTFLRRAIQKAIVIFFSAYYIIGSIMYTGGYAFA